MSSATTAGLWLGTYPADGPGGHAGGGEGIWRLELDRATGDLTGTLAAPTPAPSFLATSPDGRTLYSVGEASQGTVSCFAVGADGGLTERGRVSSGGSCPCHVLVDPAGRALYVSNYADGSVSVLTLAADGGFSDAVLDAGGPVQVLEGAEHVPGPVAQRQDGRHAHSALLAPGEQVLLVADLGADELRRFRVHDDGTLTEDGVALRFDPGTGPRHLVAGRGDHLYVVGELSATVHVLAWDRDAGVAHPVQTAPASLGPLVSGEHTYPAHPVLHDGRLLVSVRGPDVVAQFEVHDGGALLQHLGETPVGGSWPRHLAVVPGAGTEHWVVTAVEGSGRVTVLGLASGAVLVGEDVRGSLDVPYPACVLPADQPA